jgi:hypothetical protein
MSCILLLNIVVGCGKLRHGRKSSLRTETSSLLALVQESAAKFDGEEYIHKSAGREKALEEHTLMCRMKVSTFSALANTTATRRLLVDAYMNSSENLTPSHAETSSLASFDID